MPANADYNLYALSFTGTLKWVTPFQADQAIWGSPVSDGTNVYFGTLGRQVYAVNAQTGHADLGAESGWRHPRISSSGTEQHPLCWNI